MERRILTAAARVKVGVRWVRDTGDAKSDHRELALAGAPAAKLGVPDRKPDSGSPARTR